MDEQASLAPPTPIVPEQRRPDPREQRPTPGGPDLAREDPHGIAADSVVRRALARFVGAVFLAVLVLAAGTVLLSRHVAHEEAIHDARTNAERLATQLGSEEPDLGLRHTEPQARAALSQWLRARMEEAGIAHAKVWDRSGTVLWADDPAIVGDRLVLTPAVADLFGTRRSVVEATDEHRQVPGGEEVERAGLVEVYVGAEDVTGEPFVFETYTDRDRLRQESAALLWQLVSVGLGAIVLFAAITLPLALSLARRVDRARVQRSSILTHALRSLRHDRRRLAQDLHDGVLQDLSAVGYALPRLVDLAADGSRGAEARRLGGQLGALIADDVTGLRRIAGDLMPPDLSGDGLVTELEEMADRLRRTGLVVRVRVEDLEADVEVLQLVHRVVREGLRNVLKHAEADRVLVEVTRIAPAPGEDVVRVRVVDDGRGFPARRLPTERPLGLRLLRDMVRDVGGDVRVGTAPEGGVRLEADLPLRLAR